MKEEKKKRLKAHDTRRKMAADNQVTARTQMQISHLTIKIRITCFIAALLFLIMGISGINAASHLVNVFLRKDIISYSFCNYVQGKHGYRNYQSDYFIIIDETQEKWRISPAENLDVNFFTNVRSGERLEVTYLPGRFSDNEVVVLTSDTENAAIFVDVTREFHKIGIVYAGVTVVVIFFVVLTVRTLVLDWRKRKNILSG
ncbi:hypothetical protein [uncultured Ruminococcus sp.]|uniref:hypothetical protein n=1 Tax=uncultured Ruminococcus sp. TaxID=165186 RepID=UPI00261F63C7|nr:hypothetical protein [uncultured Ruminococcus sp.]